MNDFALATLTDNNFIQGTLTSLFSLKKHNTWFNYPIIIMSCDLSDANKKLVEKLYNNVQFFSIQESDFNLNKESKVEKNRNVGGNRLLKAFYKLSLFSIENYDRIVFLDSDTLILQDISALFANDEEIIATPDVSIIKNEFNKNPSSWKGNMNTGVMSFSKKFLNKEVYSKMLSMMRKKKHIGLADQDIINDYFQNIPKKFLHYNYNCLKRVKAQSPDYFHLHKVKILHFVGKKPWSDKIDHPIEKDPAYGPLELLWHVYYNEMSKTING